MASTMTALADGGGGYAEMVDSLSDTQLSIKALFDDCLAKDLAERDKAVQEAGLRCPERKELAKLFDKRGGEMSMAVPALRERVNEELHKYRNSANAAVRLSAGAGAWRGNAAMYPPIIDKMRQMQAGQDKWKGRGGYEYWEKIPGQIRAAEGQQEAAEQLAETLERTAAGHGRLTLVVWCHMLTLESSLQGAVGLVGGDGVYFRRSAQALVAGQALLDAVVPLKKGDDYEYLQVPVRAAEVTTAAGEVPPVPPVTSRG